MGVCEETPKITGMHWQQHDRYVGPAYDPSRDLSPNLPCSDTSSSMGEGDVGATSTASSTCTSTTDNNNGLVNASSCCHAEPPACKLEEGAGVTCAGCGSRIADRFYLLAVERRWHAACLTCCQCRQPLDGEVTCFARDGNIYCKKDYYRLFGMKRCGRCQAAISSSELVMRARDLVFHVHCFTCTVCHAPLTKGDHFGMHGPHVFCQQHYEPPAPAVYHTPPFPSPADYPGGMSLPPQPPPNPSPCGLGDHSSKVQSFFNGAPAARQKGRPRKRKPKDLEGMTASLDLNSDSYLDVSTPFGRSGHSPGGMSGGGNSQSRTKRMRTSFKHHQLRTMKSYFAINHNPDAKDLKQLSQKTGLPKRVLQVWFQNARAKWRRLMIKQEGKVPPEKGVGSPGDLQQYGGSQTGSEYHGMHLPETSCSPHYLMSSPPSLDCS